MRNLSAAVLFLLSFSALTGAAENPSDIHSIDFKNFSFPWDTKVALADKSTWHWIAWRPQTVVRVKNGIHFFREAGQSDPHFGPRLSADAVTYGDLDGDGSEEAAVHLNYGTGGTQSWDYLYVYKLVDGHSKLIGLLVSGERGDGGLVRCVIQNNVLVLDFADPNRRAGDCCSEGYVRVHYHWRNGAFVEEGVRERGDLPLKTL